MCVNDVVPLGEKFPDRHLCVIGLNTISREFVIFVKELYVVRSRIICSRGWKRKGKKSSN